MTTTAELRPGQLIVEIRIPWSGSIPKPEKGDVWGVNLFRCVGPEAPERYLAWRPTRTPEPNYHVPSAFGDLRFEF
jgi:alpha-galactosidase